MKSKNVSIRELALLGVLLIVVVYYFVIQLPITNQMNEISAQQSDVDAQTDEATAKLLAMKQMQTELETLKAGGSAKSLPEYNNLNAVLQELNTTLSNADSYQISFDDEQFESSGYVVSRSYNLNYTAGSYDDAIAILREIMDSDFVYLLEDLSISKSETTDLSSCSVTATLTCFEHCAQSVSAAAAAGNSSETDKASAA